MQKLLTGLLVLVGITQILPVMGVVGTDRLTALYGLTFEEPNLAILMRHRAVLFGLLGSFIIYSAFRPTLQPLAFVAGLISIVSFIALAWSIGGYNVQIRNVVIGDLVAIVCLVAAIAVYFVAQERQ